MGRGRPTQTQTCQHCFKAQLPSSELRTELGDVGIDPPRWQEVLTAQKQGCPPPYRTPLPVLPLLWKLNALGPGPPGGLRIVGERTSASGRAVLEDDIRAHTGHPRGAPDADGHLPSGPDRPPSPVGRHHGQRAAHVDVELGLSVSTLLESFFFVRGVKSKSPKEGQKAPRRVRPWGAAEALEPAPTAWRHHNRPRGRASSTASLTPSCRVHPTPGVRAHNSWLNEPPVSETGPQPQYNDLERLWWVSRPERHLRYLSRHDLLFRVPWAND